jgi:hypothetical protein
MQTTNLLHATQGSSVVVGNLAANLTAVATPSQTESEKLLAVTLQLSYIYLRRWFNFVFSFHLCLFVQRREVIFAWNKRGRVIMHL